MQINYRQLNTVKEFIDAIRLRVDVFILEQKCPPGWEPDELDKESEQYIALVDGKVVATARLREEPKGAYKIERMVVKKEYRGKGIGEGLTKYIVSEAKKRKPTKIWMEAQAYAKKFYEKCVFKAVSDEYDQWNLGIPHFEMELQT